MRSSNGLSPELTSASGALDRTETAFSAALSAVLGLLIIGIVGFSQIEVMHNAVHDTRHAAGFPCH
jgi:cobalt transporter subunit CbtB